MIPKVSLYHYIRLNYTASAIKNSFRYFPRVGRKMIYGIKGGGGGGGDLKNQLTRIVIRNSPSREAPPPNSSN